MRLRSRRWGEQFSEFYLLTENPDGELFADGYPEELERGERAEMIVGIENNEYEPTNYTVVSNCKKSSRKATRHV